MKTVAKKIWTDTYVVKNSKFETFIFQVSDVLEVEEFLQKYTDSKATHNCYAYIIGFHEKNKKSNDDGEPSHSSGFAILKILEEKQITNTIVLVRRYFQPPKLGVGPLMRAYQFSLIKYLQKVKLLSILPSKKYQLVVPINLVSLVYEWQKQNYFIILDQKNEDFKIIFFINLVSQNHDFMYHKDIKMSFLEETFIISDN